MFIVVVYRLPDEDEGLEELPPELMVIGTLLELDFPEDLLPEDEELEEELQLLQELHVEVYTLPPGIGLEVV